MSDATTFKDLNALAAHLRQELENKKFILLYAYNGTGKTRLLKLSWTRVEAGRSVRWHGTVLPGKILSAGRRPAGGRQREGRRVQG